MNVLWKRFATVFQGKHIEKTIFLIENSDVDFILAETVEN
jgi:hypothetical protein